VKLRLTISLSCVDANAVASAINVDNLTAPKGLNISCHADNKHTLTCYLTTDLEEGPLALLRVKNTIDDLLINVEASAKTLERVSKESC